MDDHEYLEQTLEQAQAIMQKLDAAEGRILEVMGIGVGADGQVKATSNGRGGITELTFDPRVLRLDVVELGREVTVALQSAQFDAERQAQEIVSEVMVYAEAMPEPPNETYVRNRVEQVARELF
ncbi:YbaB/EbfC family nucleoid-associated protein [Nonomuraea sp. NPDC049152]|uniref:YbaB/EbfC family nucleoid-associated protein n=1 Tax=Nonomuraea sp. NPDC049152 TaxID=3154350 RepID=UPI0033D12FE9